MMRHRPIGFVVFPLAMLFLAFGCSRPEAPGRETAPAEVPGIAPGAAAPGAAAEGKALFGEKCGVCHQLERLAYRRERREDWTRIVKDMQGKREAWISDAEAARIIEYLAETQGK